MSKTKVIFVGWENDYDALFINTLANDFEIKHVKLGKVLSKVLMLVPTYLGISKAFTHMLAGFLKVKKGDIVICNDIKYAIEISKELCLSRDAQGILFFRNTVDKDLLGAYEPLYGVTFDPNDARQHGLKLVNQFVADRYITKVRCSSTRKAYFLGLSKDREDALGEIEKEFSAFINIELDIKKTPSRYLPNFLVRTFAPPQYRFIPYTQYLDKVAECQFVIDVSKDGQSGLTMRAIEALFFEKKIITNNSLIKNLDVFPAENVFLIGEDRNVEAFLNSQFTKVDDDLKEQFSALHVIRSAIESIKYE